MDMHPTLTTVVYILIAAIFVILMAYMFVYNSRLKAKRATLNEKGRLPLSKEEGIAVATMQKERSGRSGTIT
jgi:hypothetical protein